MQGYEQYAKMNAAYAPPLAKLEQLRYAGGEFDEALQVAHAMVKACPYCAEAYRMRASMFLKFDRPEAAVQDAQTAT